ncbi:hypothetical protein [Streptomyces sp. NPDC055107]
MSTLTMSRREFAAAEGRKVLDRLIPELHPGQHLLSVRVEIIGGQVIPARVLIDVAGAELSGIVSMEPSQMDSFATVLGAGIQTSGSTVAIELRSPKVNGPGTYIRAWEKLEWVTTLRALSPDERKSVSGDNHAVDFRQAFALSVN